MRSSMKFSNGVQRETKTRFGTGATAVPRADTITANEGESIGSITQRAYGANTRALQNKLLRANAEMRGTIIVPR